MTRLPVDVRSNRKLQRFRATNKVKTHNCTLRSNFGYSIISNIEIIRVGKQELQSNRIQLCRENIYFR